ncbi:uncharacterized protein LOC143488617 isoform X2 [Brachyhypopomus gauderio]|uniref:uncharacterized protein LOC143488617 isoform X2 n=1 Tax=Brachyhypopomus gauderio TaxID=698409 RepID=UPI0040418C80
MGVAFSYIRCYWSYFRFRGFFRFGGFCGTTCGSGQDGRQLFASHLLAGQDGQFTIYKCHLTCRKSPHFHCYYCGQTIIRKICYMKHLTSCSPCYVKMSKIASEEQVSPPERPGSTCAPLPGTPIGPSAPLPGTPIGPSAPLAGTQRSHSAPLPWTSKSPFTSPPGEPRRPFVPPPASATAKEIPTDLHVDPSISTFCKCCYRCGMVYRYQEWSHGLHNYNDHIILDLHLCLYLRASLQTHNAAGRVFEAMELTSAVVVMDLHRKGVFNMPVSEIPAPPPNYNGEVNLEEFWNSIALKMIAHGFVSSTLQNPFVVHPTYAYWAPWIGPHTRKCNDVLNTEWEKVHHSVNPAEMADLDVSEDRLLNEVLNLKVDDVRKLCRASGVDPSGFKMDLVLRLREEIKSRNAYDKIFEKVWGASGGWTTIMCPCGIVYSVKFNMRAESPRDYMDLLLSWKYMPNVTVYDFARGLATHGNLRVPEMLPFTPNEGRLLSPTEENLQLANEEKIKVHLSWLKEKKKIPDDGGHPLTGSSDHYVLYDTLHESNSKDSKDVLKRIALVPELAGWMNSQVAEQRFSQMERNNYFLNMMAPSVQIFLIRNIIHHRNQLQNKQTTENVQKAMGNAKVTVNTFGQVVICKESSSLRSVPCNGATLQTPSTDQKRIPGADACKILETKEERHKHSWINKDMLPS